MPQTRIAHGLNSEFKESIKMADHAQQQPEKPQAQAVPTPFYFLGWLHDKYGPVSFGIIVMAILAKVYFEPQIAAMTRTVETIQSKNETIKEVAGMVERASAGLERTATTINHAAATMNSNTERLDRIIDKVENMKP